MQWRQIQPALLGNFKVTLIHSHPPEFESNSVTVSSCFLSWVTAYYLGFKRCRTNIMLRFFIENIRRHCFRFKHFIELVGACWAYLLAGQDIISSMFKRIHLRFMGWHTSSLIHIAWHVYLFIFIYLVESLDWKIYFHFYFMLLHFL